MSYNENISSNHQPAPLITMENYEMYFLMYIDRELNESEMAAVDAFLLIHPELQEEMDQLKSTVLELPNIESITLPNKMSLYKSEENQIDAALEEKMILSIDHELNDKEEQQLQEELKNNLPAQQLYQNYQSTRLPLETIVYPHKEALYKSTGKTISIFRARWVELSFAAAIAFLVVVNIYEEQTPKQIIDEANRYPTTTNRSQITDNQFSDNNTATLEVKPNSTATTVNNSNVINNSKFDNNNSNIQPNNNRSVTNPTTVIASVTKNENNVIETPVVVEIPTQEKNISDLSNISISPNVEHTNTSTEVIKSDEEFIASFNLNNDSEALLADQQLEDLKSLMATNDLKEINDEYSSDPIPLRGLFRKLKNEVFKHNRNSKSSYSIHFR